MTAGLGAVTPDGRHIVYYSDLKGGVRHIWRMDVDGGNQIQLTDGEGENDPTCSPDGRWVVYTKLETKGGDRPNLWKIPIDGGAPARLTHEFSLKPSVSPDGKLIACIYAETRSSEAGLAVFPFDGVAPVKTFRNRSEASRMSDGRRTVAASFTRKIPTRTRPRSWFNRSTADRRDSWPDSRTIASSASNGRATANTWPACEGCWRRTLF